MASDDFFISEIDQDAGVSTAPSTVKSAGMGLFVDKDFAKNAKIIKYEGEHIDEKEFLRRYAKQKPEYVLKLKGRIIDASDPTKSNLARYANHRAHSKANARISNTGWLVAEKPIKKGAEIFIDYGPAFWKVMKK